MKLPINHTLVVITSALFVGAKGERLVSPSPHRVARLQKSVNALLATGFSDFVLLDNTVPTGFDITTLPTGQTVSLVSLSPSDTQLPSNEFALNGPSRLETVLLGQAITTMRERLKAYEYVLKISAGYTVKNLEGILQQAGKGVVFRMGNPLRREIKFCLSSFYILPAQHFLNLAAYLTTKLADMSNLKPLEYHLYAYVQQVANRLVVMPYPQFDADFLSSGRSSSDLNYRLKELVFRLLARLGLYAYVIK